MELPGMRLYLVAVGDFGAFTPVETMARRNSGCEVVVLREVPDSYMEWKTQAEKCTSRPLTLGDSIFRWFAISDHLDSTNYNGQVAVLDWDVCVFMNLEQSWSGHRPAECGRTTSGPWEAKDYMWPYAFANADLIHQMIGFLWECLPEWSPDQDMSAWSTFLETKPDMLISDLQSKPKYGIWDHTVYAGLGQWKLGEDGAKIVRWIHGHPHFINGSTGELERAATIHCWSDYKSKPWEYELLNRTKFTTR